MSTEPAELPPKGMPANDGLYWFKTLNGAKPAPAEVFTSFGGRFAQTLYPASMHLNERDCADCYFWGPLESLEELLSDAEKFLP